VAVVKLRKRVAFGQCWKLETTNKNPKGPRMETISRLSLVRNVDVDEEAPTVEVLRSRATECGKALLEWVMTTGRVEGPLRFRDFESGLRERVWALARALIVLFLAVREEHLQAREAPHTETLGARFRRVAAKPRNLTTLFGVVRYFRRYHCQIAEASRHGYHVLDVSLGLLSDRFSLTVLSLAVRLATKLSFAEARSTLALFMPNAPSTEVIEQSVLGLARHAPAWIEHAPAPGQDGDVLVMMFDSKGAPTATAEELSRRRGKRSRRPKAPSPRHRGKARRAKYPKKPRRAPGDKSKNAKMATMVVMYTLRRDGDQLLGPINKWVYASFANKRHTFEIARREANKRGFGPGTKRTVQIVTDGDKDLAIYAKEYFPNAIHTLDVMHVIEKLWAAGECLYKTGSDELATWIARQKERLYGGRIAELLAELQTRLDSIAATGPGNKGRRQRLGDAIRYLKKRVEQMNYRAWIEQDLEIASGAVEGAIKNVIGKRCDHGGMRWIEERAEALLQLRCIEINGAWDAFLDHAELTMSITARTQRAAVRLQTQFAAPLPVAAAPA